MDTPTLQFTKEGYENLQKELEKLTSRRPQVVINLTNAREQGDLSENAGYHAAKEELGQIDSRVREVKYLLKFGKIVQGTNRNKVNFGSKVTLEASGSKIEFQIVEELEADPAKGKISTTSPIGKALLNKKEGEKIEVNTPDGQKTFKLIKITS